jgi:hypothetical protein
MSQKKEAKKKAQYKEITPDLLKQIDNEKLFVFNPYSTPFFHMTKEDAKKVLDEAMAEDDDDDKSDEDFIAKFRVGFEKLAGKKLNDMEVGMAFTHAMDMCGKPQKPPSQKPPSQKPPSQSLHLKSLHLKSLHLKSLHLISLHLKSLHLKSLHLKSLHLKSPGAFLGLSMHPPKAGLLKKRIRKEI